MLPHWTTMSRTTPWSDNADYAGLARVTFRDNPDRNYSIDSAGNVQDGVITSEIAKIELKD